jgi:hypothetical protein
MNFKARSIALASALKIELADGNRREATCRMPFIYSIADYRANYFDAERLYTQPEDFEPNFCIKRGATVTIILSISINDTSTSCLANYDKERNYSCNVPERPYIT